MTGQIEQFQVKILIKISHFLVNSVSVQPFFIYLTLYLHLTIKKIIK